ncbi:hypothetical protein HPB51_027803 [Rhipicephalus microplus]|uniref:Uncharacterized protein n=1 Tax=Rhipicephalus microplus TaxID=6941 RepID=A0A9J6CZ23_RHIMP|nr:hypothetical protein HPB51_027803 [Rhipicephalus microplus]
MFENPPRLRECRELLNWLESLCASLDGADREVSTLSQITVVCRLLKKIGASMELDFEIRLDRCFAVFRNVWTDNQLSAFDWLRLIEVIELCSMGWKRDPVVNEYYTCKYNSAISADEHNVLLEQQACVINQAHISEQLPQLRTGKPEIKTAAPSATGTTVDLGGQLKTSSVAHGETEQLVRKVTMGTEVAYVSGMSESVVNMITSAVQSLHRNVTADTLWRTNQTQTFTPPNPAATVMSEVEARPLIDIPRSGGALHAPCAQATSHTPGITNRHESNSFKKLESRTDLLSSVQYSGCVHNKHELSSALKSLNTSSERGQLNFCGGRGDPAWFSSGDDGHLLSSDFNARGRARADSLETQFGRHAGLK